MSERVARSSNLRDPDGFYAALIEAHRGLSDQESELLNARLALILANHIGEPEVLADALMLARGRLAPEAVGGIHGCRVKPMPQAR